MFLQLQPKLPNFQKLLLRIFFEKSESLPAYCVEEISVFGITFGSPAVHPMFDRALTVRECARLQSFPDCYDFAGGPYLVPHIERAVQDKYEQIGDAVPPLLAYEWGKKIIELLEEDK